MERVMKKKILLVLLLMFLTGQFAFAKGDNKFLTRGQFVQLIYDQMSTLPNFENIEDCGKKFRDVSANHPNCKAIEYVYFKHCGTPSKKEYECLTFEYMPDKITTQIEFPSVLSRFFEIIEYDYKIKFSYSAETLMKFSDLPDDKEVCDAVLKVTEMGIIEGYPSGTKKENNLYGSEGKKPVPLSEAKKYFAIIKSTTEKLLKEKGLTLKDPAK